MPSTDLDLTAAVDAAARAGYQEAVKAHKGGDAPLQWHELTDAQRQPWTWTAFTFVTAAAPYIAGSALDLEAARIGNDYVDDGEAAIRDDLILTARAYYEEAGE